MTEYISREDGFNAILKLVPKVDGDGYCWVIRGDADTAIDSIPAADVRPVKRGMWASVFDIGTVCNQCGFDIEEHGYDVRTDGEPNFCPNCGADMRPESPKEE